jgi:ribosome-binding protein aMBF1 (putative translation factor)
MRFNFETASTVDGCAAKSSFVQISQKGLPKLREPVDMNRFGRRPWGGKVMSAKNPNEMDEHIGRRIRERRHELKMSQQALAKEIRVAFQQVQKYENGKNRITAVRLFVFSHVLRVPVLYFFEGLRKPKRKAVGAQEC